MGKEKVSFQELVYWLLGQFLYTINDVLIDMRAAKLLDQFVVIDLFASIVDMDIRVDNYLFLLRLLVSLLYLWFFFDWFGRVKDLLLMRMRFGRLEAKSEKI